jgi:AcrR family transcriptional regulator
MAGRPREFDRDVALRRAQAAFWTRGYEGTSMSDLVGAMGIASARIYAAFGSKEALFREAVELYLAEEGRFVLDAMTEEAPLWRTFERILRQAALIYTRPGRPRGCLVVTAATNVAVANDPLMQWLAHRRREQTDAIIVRTRRALARGELPSGANARAIGDAFAAILHGLSVQARDGVSRARLLALIAPTMQMLGPQQAT